MATLANTAEGGSNATTVTTANSGSGSGNAWDNVTIGSGGAITYDNTHTYGTLAYKFVSAATATFVAWTSTSVGTQATLFGRCYIYLTANPSAELAIARLRLGTNQTARLGITTAGKLVLRNAANSQVGLQATSISLNAWVRVEFKITASSTAGVYEVKLFNSPDSTSATETTTLTSQVLTDNLDTVNFGPAGTTSGVTFWMDGLAVATAGYLGPAVQSVSLSDTTTVSDSPSQSCSSTRSITDTTTAADSITRASATTRPVVDAIAADAALIRAVAVTVRVADAIAIPDDSAGTFTASRSLADAANLADAGTCASASVRTTTDDLHQLDALDRQLTALRTPAETLAAGNQSSRGLTLTRLATDGLVFVELASVPLDISLQAGTPARDWSAALAARARGAREPARVWSVGEPGT